MRGCCGVVVNLSFSFVDTWDETHVIGPTPCVYKPAWVFSQPELDFYSHTHNLVRNDPYTHFSLVIFYYFLQKENKKNNKILPATSACCRAVVRNECRDHFSNKKKTKQNKKIIIKYYQPRQLVVGLLWEMSVWIISQT